MSRKSHRAQYRSIGISREEYTVLSQREVAAKLGISQARVMQLENKALKKLALAFRELWGRI